MKTVLICPFDLNRLTGTPIRARATLRALSEFTETTVVSNGLSEDIPNVDSYLVKGKRLLQFSWEALSVMRRTHPDIVHGITTASVLPMVVYKLFFNFRVKIIFEIHGWSWLELGEQSSLVKRVGFLLLDYVGLWCSSLIIVMSFKARDFLSPRTWKSERIVVQWCATEFLTPFIEPPLAATLRVGYIGNDAWWQGLPNLIAAAKLLAHRTDISFALAGFNVHDNSSFPILKNVSYLGKITRDKVPDFLHSCDVLISPRLNDVVGDIQFPQKFSDYFSSGRPVIASATGDQPEVIKEAECGLIVDPLTPENLAHAITTFADLARAEQRLWAQRAFTYARRHFSFGVFANNLQSFYWRVFSNMRSQNPTIPQGGRRRALVIGAGIHGATIAIELAKHDYEVSVVDAGSDILTGTSGATHNRIHLGYHYPRSVETALECKAGYQYFKKHFGQSMHYPDFYYLIGKSDSRVSAEEYRNFIKQTDLTCEEVWPEEAFLDRDSVAATFKVKEAYFDLTALREILWERFRKHNIRTHLNFFITNVDLGKQGNVTLHSSDHQSLQIEAHLIVNATYTYTNSVQKIFGITDPPAEYEFENTEIAVVHSNVNIPALTIMDGPFVSILPYGGHPGEYLVYDVVHSVVSRNFGTEHQMDKGRQSNWPRMREHGRQYYPFFKDLSYRYSLWAHRPIPLTKKAQSEDSRVTRIIKHRYPISFYSILEGKLVSAPMVAEDFISRLKRNNE